MSRFTARHGGGDRSGLDARRVAAALAGLGALTATFGFLCGGGGDRRLIAVEPADREATFATASVDVEANMGGAALDSQTPTSRPRADPWVDRDDQPAPSGRVVVRVTDLQGAPAEGATVEARREVRATHVGRTRPAEARAISDGEGLAALDLPAVDVEVTARRGAASGRVRVTVDDVLAGDVHEVALRPDRRVEVRVVDDREMPVEGVCVALKVGGPRPDARFVRGDPTDAAGRAVVVLDASHAGLFEAPGLTAVAAGASCAVVFEDGTGRATVRLADERAGSMVVRAVVPPDVPTPASFRFGVALDADGPSPTMWRLAHDVRSAPRPVATLGGLRRGATYRFLVGAPGRTPAGALARVPEDGSRGAVDVPLGPEAATLRWRLIDGLGAPLRGVASFRLDQDGARPNEKRVNDRSGDDDGMELSVPWRAPLDADGVFRVEVAPGIPGVLKLFGPRPHPAGVDPWRRGGVEQTREFAALAPGAVVDVAPYAWPLAPILVAGRVVDAEGRPTAGAVVEVMRDRLLLAGGAGATLDDARTRTDAEGRFEIRAEMRQEIMKRLRLRARTGAAVSEDAVLESGRADLVLTLEPFGALEGVVRRTPAAAEGRILAESLRRGDPRASREECDRDRAVEPDVRTGAFGWKRLEPGVHDVKIFYDDRLVVVLEGVEIRPGERSSDPRLRDLVVGDAFRTEVVSVVDAGGRAVAGAAVTLYVGIDRTYRGQTVKPADRDGRTEWSFVRAPDRASLSVTAPWGETVRVRDVTFPATVRLTGPPRSEERAR
ncbi:MAG TPA: hypothetical protein VEI02_10380 [Planctomycetota bacterium]|nr:hypothetical protein [Planctomycetota bacterium]